MLPQSPQETRWLPMSPRTQHVLACVLLVLLTAGTFGNALWNGFVSFDDWRLIETNHRIRSLSPSNVAAMFRYRTNDTWLPLRELSYAVDHAIWGLRPFGFHLTNILLHAANVLLVYALLVWLLRRPGLALLGAACFAVHPAQVEAVTWASGRRDVQYAFFFLLSFLSFLAYERREGRGRWGFYAASLGCLVASLLSKAAAMTLPAVLVLTILATGSPDKGFWRRLAACVPHWVVTVAITVVHLVEASGSGIVKGQALGTSLANVPLIFSKYLGLLFFPVHLAAPHGDRSFPGWSLDNPWMAWLLRTFHLPEGALIALLAAVVVGFVVVVRVLAPRRRTAIFCLVWWFLLLLPVSNLLPLSALVAERYLYLPLVGACGLGAELVGSLMKRQRVLVLGCALAVVALFAVATHSRNRVWESGQTFWRDGVSKWPNIPVMRIGLGAEYVDAKDYERAWAQYMAVALGGRRAFSRHPDHVELVNGGLEGFYDTLGRQREAEGDRDGALDVYETVVRLMEDRPQHRVRAAQAYERTEATQKAREQVVAARELLAQWAKRLEERAEESSSGGLPQGSDAEDERPPAPDSGEAVARLMADGVKPWVQAAQGDERVKRFDRARREVLAADELLGDWQGWLRRLEARTGGPRE